MVRKWANPLLFILFVSTALLFHRNDCDFYENSIASADWNWPLIPYRKVSGGGRRAVKSREGGSSENASNRVSPTSVFSDLP